ncbi:MAG: hypothetical protein ABUL62_01645 [Myxococcales bacterium]
MSRSKHWSMATLAGAAMMAWGSSALAQATPTPAQTKAAQENAAKDKAAADRAADDKAEHDSKIAADQAAREKAAADEAAEKKAAADALAAQVQAAAELKTAAAELKQATEAKVDADKQEKADAKAKLDAAPEPSFLDNRCALAFCFGDGHAIGIEPLVELPFGKSFSASNGAVADYVNNHDLKVDLAAGVRVWMFKDLMSLSLYLSKPLTDRTVRIPGSAFEYPAAALRRPYPGIALGLLYDTLWVGLDHDELRNPDGTSGVAHDPTYPPNSLVGSSWTITVAIQPLTSFRNGIGVAKKVLSK